MDEAEECDRCGATIVRDSHKQLRPLTLALDVSDPDSPDPQFERTTRLLCDACEEDLLEWIDEGNIDRGDCVDLPTSVEAATVLERTSGDLNALAETLRESVNAQDD